MRKSLEGQGTESKKVEGGSLAGLRNRIQKAAVTGVSGGREKIVEEQKEAGGDKIIGQWRYAHGVWISFSERFVVGHRRAQNRAVAYLLN